MDKNNYINVDTRFNTYDDRCQLVVPKEGAYYSICEHISDWCGIKYSEDDFLTEEWIDKLDLCEEKIDHFISDGHVLSKRATYLISGARIWAQPGKIECTRQFLLLIMGKEHLK